MKEMILHEIRESNRAINGIKDDVIREAGDKLLQDTIELMGELSSIGREQGLLALEVEAYKLEDFENGQFLKNMIMLIVDGTDPEVIEEVCLTRYFALALEGYDALQYLVMMIGSLAVQQGENPRLIEERLLSLVSVEVETEYRNRPEDPEKEKKKQERLWQEFVEPLYRGELAVDPGDDYYFPIKLADYAVNALDDSNLQRFLREIENSTLEMAMKGFSGETRRRLLSNMSTRLTIMVGKDMSMMYDVSKAEIATAAETVFRLILTLMNKGEITSSESEKFQVLQEIFELPGESSSQEQDVFSAAEVADLLSSLLQ